MSNLDWTAIYHMAKEKLLGRGKPVSIRGAPIVGKTVISKERARRVRNLKGGNGPRTSFHPCYMCIAMGYKGGYRATKDDLVKHLTNYHVLKEDAADKVAEQWKKDLNPREKKSDDLEHRAPGQHPRLSRDEYDAEEKTRKESKGKSLTPGEITLTVLENEPKPNIPIINSIRKALGMKPLVDPAADPGEEKKGDEKEEEKKTDKKKDKKKAKKELKDLFWKVIKAEKDGDTTAIKTYRDEFDKIAKNLGDEKAVNKWFAKWQAKAARMAATEKTIKKVDKAEAKRLKKLMKEHGEPAEKESLETTVEQGIEKLLDTMNPEHKEFKKPATLGEKTVKNIKKKATTKAAKADEANIKKKFALHDKGKLERTASSGPTVRIKGQPPRANKVKKTAIAIK